MKFFKLVFANIVAWIIISVVTFFLMLGYISNLTRTESVVIKPNSILEVNLQYGLPDRATSSFDKAYFSNMNTGLGLNQVLESIKYAKTDDNIKGIYLNLSGIDAGTASSQEIRKALVDFKESDKFIYAYSDSYSQRDYYLASVADMVYAHQEGILEFRGLVSQFMSVKGALSKLGVEMQIIRHGKFKSAVEPFMNDKMSPENREQTQKYLDGIWASMLAEISESRGLSVDELNKIADGMDAFMPLDAVKVKLIDDVKSHAEMQAVLMTAVDVEDEKNLEIINLSKYAKHVDSKPNATKTKDKIAIVYAQGDIIMGDGNGTAVGSDDISKAIRKAANDKNVKAIVLRVNSPGGSALASDIILNEVKLAKEKKPVVASFGGYAASGGYYISCGATTIISDPTTLTGSIGVFGTIPNVQKLTKDKLGVNFEVVTTNQNSDFLDLTRPMNSLEKQKMQVMVENTYDVFISHVAEGRNMTKEQVDEIGQGRVWCGADALKIGLVDEIGGLEYAIEKAAELAGLSAYKIVDYPKLKDPFTQLMEAFGQAKVRTLKAEMGEYYEFYNTLKTISEESAIQARLPFFINID